MGGILVRQMERVQPHKNLGRVVMLSPPNNDSEIVDRIGHTWIFNRVNGPAGQQLATHTESFVKQLGPVDFDCGILTGDRSWNWIHSRMIPRPNDGKVSVQSIQLEGMSDFKVLGPQPPLLYHETRLRHFRSYPFFKNRPICRVVSTNESTKLTIYSDRHPA